ncbi:ABC transporter permease [Natronosporangium hydrolyticum]|uniref:Transport permease protein n=1 Tax=Natronosporangium hydrolyticum TaxID=2811111 RepID=A0A895YIZ7_9ACTN|nr:ABC transporter permease [Natronosporangium hydrolyticum]QSB13748.1 ABC transporter permease [Natronosporangium hydrolyticum]
MSTVPTTAPPAPARARMGLFRTLGYMVQREVRRTLAAPALLFPALLVALGTFFLMSGLFGGYATEFGITDYMAYLVATTLMFGAINTSGGQLVVQDIEAGYFSKLLTTPTSRLAILLGGMIGDALRAAAIAIVVLVVTLPFTQDGYGTFATGIGGALLVIALTACWGLAYGAISHAIALKTGSAAITQAAFPIFFPFLFLAPSFGPRESMSGWVQAVAQVNPVTYVIEAQRGLMLTGWDSGQIAAGFIAIAAMAVATVTLAMLALRSRVS